MKNASKNHIREDYKKLIEALDKPEANPIQFFEVLLQEDWQEE